MCILLLLLVILAWCYSTVDDIMYSVYTDTNTDIYIFFFNSIGRYELDVISYFKCLHCSCELPCQVTIENCIESSFWPGTPSNICHLFHQDLFEYWDNLQKRMPGASERSFLFGLQDFSLNHGRVSH